MTLNLRNEQAIRKPEVGYSEPIAGEVSEIWMGMEGQHRARYRFARDWVRGKAVLDAACGNGYGSAKLYKSDAASVTGVDIAPEAIEEARRHFNAPNLSFRIADLTSLPFEAASFDVIVSFETIEHIRDYQKVISEFYRVLRPSGTLIISNPNPQVLSLGLDTPDSFYYFNQFSLVEFEQLLKRHFSKPCQMFGQFVKFQNMLHTPHLYAAAEDFVFNNHQLDLAPFLVAVCHK